LTRLVSVNVGKPREIGSIRGKRVESGIYKQPVSGPVKVWRLNLEGDEQADLEVHGGVKKAVYAYPSEHYAYWNDRFPTMKLQWGSFGENLTTEGLLEHSVHVGDKLSIGSAEFEVTQPRLPCYKLGIKFGTQRMLKWFLHSGRTGFYLSVIREGECEAGDQISMTRYDMPSPTIASIVDLRREADEDADAGQRTTK